jgi:hypothetical protein
VVAVLRERMPEASVVEVDELGPTELPTAAVVVLSAVAPMTESDCRHVDIAISRADFVIGAVSKVDAHRGWREVLATGSLRYSGMPWLAVAAQPDVGAPKVDELVEALRSGLREPTRRRRNMLRESNISRLRNARATALRDGRQTSSQRARVLRGGLAEARAALGRFVRERCSTMRTDFRARAAELCRGGGTRFEADLRDEVESTLDELEARLLARNAELAETLGVVMSAHRARPGRPQLAAPPTAPTHERRLTLVLGAGFGLGVAMAVSRLLGGLAPGLELGAFVVGGLSGLTLTTWLVMTRALLHQRALLDRWVTEVVSTTRWHGDELLAGWLLAAELGFAAELAARDEAEATRLSERVGLIDAELRGLTRLTGVTQED